MAPRLKQIPFIRRKRCLLMGASPSLRVDVIRQRAPALGGERAAMRRAIEGAMPWAKRTEHIGRS
jgi:hypothetical protein